MNTPTLSQLADIGAKAAQVCLLDEGDDTSKIVVRADHSCYTADAQAREAFAKAVLDAVGYKFPVDPEREAFDAWLKEQGGTDFIDMKESMFLSWKAGRAARDKEVMFDKEPNPETDLSDWGPMKHHRPSETDPPWIEWKGGPCPIPDTVSLWEYKLGDGTHSPAYGPPGAYADNWEYVESCGKMHHITAYRVLDWGTTKQPK